MPNEAEKNYLNWFRKAEEDEYAGKEILEGGGFPAPACFHFQQMTEKYLKGLLLFHGKEFPKVHDLLEIESLLLDVEPAIKEYENELDLLNRYYIETRYPGDYPEFSWTEAEQALEAAKRIKEFVLEKIEVSRRSKERGFVSIWLLGVAIAVIAAIGIGYTVFQFWKPTLTQPTQEQITVEETKEKTKTEKEQKSEIDTSNWKTYRNDSYRFQFKYPDNWLTFSENKEKYSIIAYSRRDFEIEKKYKIAPVYSFIECPPNSSFLNIADQSYVSFDSKELPLHGQPHYWLLVRTARLPENSSEIYLYYYGLGEEEFRPAKIDIKDIDDLFNNKNLSVIDKIKKENETNLTSGYGRWEWIIKNLRGTNTNGQFSLYMPLEGSRCGYYSSSFEFFSKGRYITLQFLSQTNRIQDEDIFYSIVSTFEFLDN